jgi:hypothetical protein
MQTFFFLASYAFRSKDQGSRKKIFPDPYPRGKKAPDPGSATLFYSYAKKI